MNIHQQHLLDLLKEVDEFCKEYDITYYCAGGTVIGAARHRGFIPWDDDIDIYMTRENFAKFDKALKEHGPDDRKLEYYEGNHERQAAVPRYHKDDDTMFCHFNLLGHSSAGTSIDVFILDPIPDDYEARVDYYAGLFAYSDLISPCHVYSHRLPLSKYYVYDKYKKIADEEGRPHAVELISDKLFRYEPTECSNYCLRWGSVILIYPIEVIGEPTYLPFEDMMIPVPHDWYRYLAIHYGMDWADLPYEETQGEHINIVRYDMKYDYFYEKRDEMFTQEQLLDLHFQWKDAEREFFRTAEPIEKYVYETQNKICRAELDKRLSKALTETGTKLLKELFESGEYFRIKDIYTPYLELQLSHAYMGRQMRHGTQFRWLFPLIMPLTEEEMDILLRSMLRTGQQRTVEKLVGIYRRGNVASTAIDEAAKIVDLINTARRSYYLGEYEEARTTIEESGLQTDTPTLYDFLWLAAVHGEVTDSQAAELAARAADESSDAVRKAWGDFLWKNNRRDEAEAAYRRLMRTCRNGLFWLDIKSKVPDIDPIPTKRLTPFTDTDLTKKQRELLEEIAGICSSNGIKYVICPDLARRMYLTGNIGYINGNREIFMDAENALKFMDVFETSGRNDRSLLSWKNGDSVRDFALVYTDKSNVFCDFRRLDQWRNMGIFITIRILRSEDTSKAYKRNVLLDEFTANLINLEQIDKRNLQSAGKRLAYARTKLMLPGRRTNFGRRLFDKSIHTELAAAGKGGFYYYTNTRGIKPVKHKYSRAMWEDICETEMNGVSYIIPVAMTAKYVPHETDLANVPPINSIFIYKSEELSWDEVSLWINDAAYATLDWEKYSVTRRKFRKISDEVWHAWWMVLKLGEELDVNETADDTVAAYMEAIEKGDNSAVVDAISKVDATVKKYAALEVPIILKSALRKCYSDYLDRSGQTDFLEEIEIIHRKYGN